MKPKKIIKNALGLTVTGVALGVGSSVLGSMGTAGTNGNKALNAMGNQMPVMGSIAGAGMVMDEMGSFGKIGKKKKGWL